MLLFFAFFLYFFTYVQRPPKIWLAFTSNIVLCHLRKWEIRGREGETGHTKYTRGKQQANHHHCSWVQKMFPRKYNFLQSRIFEAKIVKSFCNSECFLSSKLQFLFRLSANFFLLWFSVIDSFTS